jgi:hypothetical protein
MSKIMTADKLYEIMYSHTEAVRDLTYQYMLDNGDKETECQRIGMINRINALEAQMRGIDDADLKPDAEDEIPLTRPEPSVTLKHIDACFASEVLAGMQAASAKDYKAANQHQLQAAAIKYTRSIITMSRPTPFEIQHLAQFEGKTVARTYFDVSDEFVLPVLEFTDGTSAIIWRDPENNGPGHIALYAENGNTLHPEAA